MGSLIEHNNLVEILKKDMREIYPDADILTFYEFKDNKRTYAEADMILELDNEIFIFEVKSSRKFSHGKINSIYKKMNKIAKRLHSNKDIYLFYIFPTDNGYHSYFKKWGGVN